MSERPSAEIDALAEALYRMNGFAWYGRDLGEWDDPDSRIGRNEYERDRWRNQAAALHDHEWTPCPECPNAGKPCACSGGACDGCFFPPGSADERTEDA